jgi:hypothetical protein
MRITFSPTRSLRKLPIERLIEITDEVLEFPEVLMEIYWEAIQRGLFSHANHVRSLYKAAREAELADELDAMDELRREAERRAAPPPPQPQAVPSPLTRTVAPAPAVSPPLVPPNPRTWDETAALVRNAVVQKKAHELAGKQSSYEDWAAHSPLALLGYKVGKSGLSDLHRQHFLHDFVMKAVLPTSLPSSYLAEWGPAGSKLRLQRTVRHIVFQKVLRESHDAIRYSEAIEDWEGDVEFLRRTFSPTLSSSEWDEVLRQ